MAVGERESDPRTSGLLLCQLPPPLYWAGTDLALGISAAKKGTDEGVCKALIHFIKEELTTKDVRGPRNGFVHNDIAELGDLNWVVAKTIGLLEGLNQTIIWGQRG